MCGVERGCAGELMCAWLVWMLGAWVLLGCCIFVVCC